MKLNKYLWDIYKESSKGQKIIQLFSDGPLDELLEQYLGEFHLGKETTAEFIDNLIDFTKSPSIPEELTIEEAEKLFEDIITLGISLADEMGGKEELDPEAEDFLSLIPIFSTWLFNHFPDYFKPYFYKNKFYQLTRIADTFGIELPPIPLKRYKQERIKYYWELCKSFLAFQEENKMTAYEFCAFIYDFAHNFISQS
ncbi:MAG: hypothetical protein JWQ14_3696 [Adhaeribacter sp.]|nr:hypothetical protein [Adhaeribacter sp.]